MLASVVRWNGLVGMVMVIPPVLGLVSEGGRRSSLGSGNLVRWVLPGPARVQDWQDGLVLGFCSPSGGLGGPVISLLTPGGSVPPGRFLPWWSSLWSFGFSLSFRSPVVPLRPLPQRHLVRSSAGHFDHIVPAPLEGFLQVDGMLGILLGQVSVAPVLAPEGREGQPVPLGRVAGPA